MPGTQGPATSLWPRGPLLFGRSRLAWAGTLMKYAIACTVGGAALRAALAGSPLGWGGVAFAAVFIVAITPGEFSRYEVRLDATARTLTRIWKPLFGREATETTAAGDVAEFQVVEDTVSSVTMVMKDGRRVSLDQGTAVEPLQALAREASRALGVPLLETKVE